MDSLPIGDYALLSDCRSAALVSRDGSVDWLCCPRFDSPSVFCRLLDPAGGRFAIRPAGEFQASRRYVDQTMVLETTFTTTGGTAVLTDALALGRHERGHALGTGSPGILLRRLACTGGEIEAEVSYAPRPEYGLIHPILVPVPGGLAARGGADRLLLSTPVSLDVSGDTAAGRIRLTAGQACVFALGHGQMSGPPLAPWPAEKITARLSDTVAGWRSWSAIHQNYEGPWRELVRHSGRVLQALTFAPTGAIVAAPTTSLPETVGGERNWDYRYTWVRDASLTMEALWVAACPDEANKFFTFLADAAASQLEHGRDLQIMFGVGGERDLTERELPHLAGWRGSAARPGRQRRVAAAAARRLRRAAGRRPAAGRPARPARPGHPAVPGRRRGHRGQPLAGQGPGHLGGPRRAARLPLLQADVLGGGGPGHRPGRAPRRGRPGERLGGCPRGDPGGYL